MKKEWTIRILAIGYAAIMLWLLFGQRTLWVSDVDYVTQLQQNYNLIPFHTIGLFLNQFDGLEAPFHAIANLAGNVILFVPLGVFLPALFYKQRQLTWYLFWQIRIICLVELVQFFTLLGSLDVDDLILNTVGGLLGFVLFKLLEKSLLKGGWIKPVPVKKQVAEELSEEPEEPTEPPIDFMIPR